LIVVVTDAEVAPVKVDVVLYDINIVKVVPNSYGVTVTTKGSTARREPEYPSTKKLVVETVNAVGNIYARIVSCVPIIIMRGPCTDNGLIVRAYR
jgi:hypothetical protein